MPENTKTAVVTMNRNKDCKGSVRFNAPEFKGQGEPPAVDNVYVSRSMPGINAAQQIRVTVEILN